MAGAISPDGAPIVARTVALVAPVTVACPGCAHAPRAEPVGGDVAEVGVRVGVAVGVRLCVGRCARFLVRFCVGAADTETVALPLTDLPAPLQLSA